MNAQHHSATHHVHVIPLKYYLGVWGALMVFTALTIGVAFLDLGPLNIPLMLSIASIKATLVALIFMHLAYDEKFNLIVLMTALAFVVIFFAFTLIDPMTRGAVNPIERNPLSHEMDITGYSHTRKKAIREEIEQNREVLRQQLITDRREMHQVDGAEAPETVPAPAPEAASETGGTAH